MKICEFFTNFKILMPNVLYTYDISKYCIFKVQTKTLAISVVLLLSGINLCRPTVKVGLLFQVHMKLCSYVPHHNNYWNKPIASEWLPRMNSLL